MIKLEAFKVKFPCIVVALPMFKLPYTVKLLKPIVPVMVPLPKKITLPFPRLNVPELVKVPPLLMFKFEVPLVHINVPLLDIALVTLRLPEALSKFKFPLGFMVTVV